VTVPRRCVRSTVTDVTTDPQCASGDFLMDNDDGSRRDKNGLSLDGMMVKGAPLASASSVGSRPKGVAYRSPNRLLAALPMATFDLLRPFLRTVEMVQESVLVAAGDRLSQVYFPHSGVISLVVSLADGQMVEVAMIGRDSVFGGTAALDGKISLTNAMVLLPGSASILDVDHLRSVSRLSPAFQTSLIRHEQALFAQAQQTAACNAAHAVEMRLARSLLRMHDLSEESLLPLTQDALAQMMGVRRNSASISAHALQQAGVIQYSRGKIQINDLDGLKNLTCECYNAVAVQYDRLLHDD
jgi:CRP-like cAMP-binding protein